MKRVASLVGFLLVLGLLQFAFTQIWGNQGRVFLLFAVIAISLVLSLTLARAVQNLNKTLARMSEPRRQALRAQHPEEVEEMTKLQAEAGQHHWIVVGLRQFAWEVLEIAGLLVALFALPVIVSVVRDGGFSLSKSVTVWHLALGFLGAAIYVAIRYLWWRAHNPEPSDESTHGPFGDEF